MTVMIQVISLAQSINRRESFSYAAVDAQTDWSFFDAHTSAADTLNADPKHQMETIGRMLTPGEVGCYSSHVEVWKHFIRSDAKLLLVLEDDVVADWAYIGFLLRADLTYFGVNFLRLFNKVPVPQARVMSPFLSQYHHLVRNLAPPLGSQAYILTRAGAERLVKHFLVVRRPIDLEMDRAWEHGLPSLSIVPSPVFERYSNSSIGEDRFSARGSFDRYYLKRISERLRREAYNKVGFRAWRAAFRSH